MDITDHTTPWREVGQAASGVDGVVLLGGYDVIRSQRLDVVPAALRSSGILNADPDDYVVWNDDCFGDTDGDTLPELPVSRIPDAGSGALILNALSSPLHPPQSARFGIRNLNRSYADDVFGAIAGTEALNVSAPFTRGTAAPDQINANGLYVVLHGSKNDMSRFWGEQADTSPIEAFSQACVPPALSSVILAGVCWGGLVVSSPASETSDMEAITPIAIDQSVALRFLDAGATAFIGTTGAHMSPISGWVHSEFWDGIAKGKSPAKAIFDAKEAFIPRIRDWQCEAEVGYMFKTWRQFTCLGLAW
ncbi:hypothetical protein [Sphingomonas sp. PR090111-T3T-6A]|uniref:hypothetical protein n=1 Tax=Sphingomonas sp. PR090111-T3T-6A TaxID=685778 RepID=UPI0012FC07EF|nr:hypothetical protein [Sphingomonas sp. PR090111-T3T-6A]